MTLPISDGFSLKHAAQTLESLQNAQGFLEQARRELCIDDATEVHLNHIHDAKCGIDESLTSISMEIAELNEAIDCAEDQVAA